MSSLKEKLQAHSIPSLQYLCVAYSGLEFGAVVSGFQYLAGCVFLSYTATWAVKCSFFLGISKVLQEPPTGLLHL